MRRATQIATFLTMGAAAFSWFAFSILPTLSVGNSYPDVQMPMAVVLSLVGCYFWTLLWIDARRRDSETRCRACGHILRGLSEPRCPECGEHI